jgi:hypothetical protein
MLCLAIALAAAQDDSAALVERFLNAPTPAARAEAADELVETDADFWKVHALLEAGRGYAEDVPRGRLLRSMTGTDGLDHKYMILVPEDYTPDRCWPVRWDLHGGMGAEEWTELDGSWSPGWTGARDQIVVIPAGWWDSMWWEWSQAHSFEAILDEVKRTWNVDENRVVMYGGSDGCIGTYFYAMRQPDRWAGYAGHVGSPDRLVRVALRPDGQMHVSNLSGQRFHLGFGERDPKAPLKYLKRYLQLFEERGALIDWYVLLDQGHSITIPNERERELGRFLWNTRRDPLPDSVTWASERCDRYNRRSWLVLDQLATPEPADEVETDEILPRWGSSIQMRGPTTKPRPWGQVAVAREGQHVRATTRRVKRFTLLLSPAEFDLTRPVRVDVDGRTAFDGMVEPSLETLLRWASVDDDRSMLFAAELTFDPPPTTKKKLVSG